MNQNSVKQVKLITVSKAGNTVKEELTTLEEVKNNYPSAEFDYIGEVYNGKIIPHIAWIAEKVKTTKIKTTKGRRIEGEFKVLDAKGYIVGCMTWETAGLKLEHIETGEIVYWISDKVEQEGLYNTMKETVTLKGFVRQNNNHLYRVTVL